MNAISTANADLPTTVYIQKWSDVLNCFIKDIKMETHGGLFQL
jgi:hypothetical protein